MSENGSGDEYFLERIESAMTGRVKILRNILPDKACQWNDNVQVVKDKPAIKISET